MSPRRNSRPTRRTPLVTVLRTENLGYDPATRTFTAEASACGWRPGDHADAVALVSHRTGRTLDVRLVHTEVNNDDEVVYWRYEANPVGVGPIALVVYND